MKTFVKFLTLNDHKPYTVKADLKTNRHGRVSIATDLQYNPLEEHPKNTDQMTFEEGESILIELGFVEVDEEFDAHNPADIEHHKEVIPVRWLELFKMWEEYEA